MSFVKISPKTVGSGHRAAGTSLPRERRGVAARRVPGAASLRQWRAPTLAERAPQAAPRRRPPRACRDVIGCSACVRVAEMYV
ncbi:unnamed protein product [Arctia plantaginis]|uniref:Uncharacterized protein n=1 Tax=Arctia plantaginis TaxID=874455 RepID=A0A8S0ZGI9_ARCPL|nr:unnamed protein product [Arctia plantaginis]